MEAVFTEHAITRIRERITEQKDQSRLLAVIDEFSKHPSELENSPKVARMRRPNGDDAFVIKIGDMRVVASVNPEKSRIVVLTVYWAKEDRPD